MPLSKLTLSPNQAGYTVAEPQDAVLRAKVSAGSSRQRLDFSGGSPEVSVVFSLDQLQYNYWRAFWRTTIAEGSLPFLIDLIIDEYDLREYEAKFVPNSVSLTNLSGLRHVVQGRLEVKMDVIDSEYDDALVMLYGEYGDQASLILSLLEQLVNHDLPGAIPG